MNNEKPLNKLSKSELVEMLLERDEELESLKGELETAKKALADRQIKINKAGTLAEASMLLNGVFEAAEEAAAQYLENIEKLSTDQDRIWEEREATCREKTQRILIQAKTDCSNLKKQTTADCKSLKQQTEEECAALKEKTEAECASLKQTTEADCAKLIEDTNQQVEEKWKSLSTRWQSLCTARDDMLEVLEVLGRDISKM